MTDEIRDRIVGIGRAVVNAGLVVAAPESTVDAETPDGRAVTIELRSEDEVLNVAGTRIAPDGARAHNPAFDVTPADLVTAVVTEQRVVRPAAGRFAGEMSVGGTPGGT